MKTIRYCTACFYPETKPDLSFNDEGVCSACTSFNARAGIDWDARRAEFLELVEAYRNTDGNNYDCIVPVSGGKDSTYQVIRLLELGINPLCVTATTDSLSDLGRRNIENLKHMGVDYIEVTSNPKVRRIMNKTALIQIGDISWPEHVSIFTIPVRLATQLNIPLIVWGENSQNEYGGPATSTTSKTLDRRWLEEFGGMLGFRVSDWIGHSRIEKRDLIQYTYPSDEDLARVGVTGVFLGYYFPWDGYTNALVAQAHGFETLTHNVEGSLGDYENLDNHQVGIHDYFKFLKYGFGRATDLANNHLRRGRLTRDMALDMIRRHDGRYPWTYLDKPLADILAEIDMTVDEFDNVCDRFTNKNLFVCDSSGQPVRDSDGNLTKINYTNA